MSGRDQILGAVSKNKPALKPLAGMDFNQVGTTNDLLETFSRQLQVVGGQLVVLKEDHDLQEMLVNEKAKGSFIINRVAAAGNIDEVSADPAVLESVQQAFIMGAPGVAENGAIWVTETAMGRRILPFICQQLVLVIRESELVANMHEAYEHIRINQEGFGVFISGPSKTADIEQSLVIGAHGPKGLTVVILQQKM